jgi:hypothetical protein
MKAPYWPRMISRSAGDHRFGVLIVWIWRLSVMDGPPRKGGCAARFTY